MIIETDPVRILENAVLQLQERVSKLEKQIKDIMGAKVLVVDKPR